jgi:malate permease and related proteins
VHILWITFQAVAVLLGIGIIGFWIIGRKRMPAAALGLLTSLAIDIALPCLVLGNVLTEFTPQQYPDWWHMPLWWLGFTAVTILLSVGTSFLVRREFRGEFAMSLLFQNGIFFPLIILNGLFKDASSYLVLLFLFIFIQPTLVFSTYPYFFRKTSPELGLNWRRIVNPVLVVTIVGIIIGLAGASSAIPPFIVSILTMVGAMAFPLFMLILGGNVYNDFMYAGQQSRKIYAREVVVFTMVKAFLFPLVFIGLLVWLRPDYPVALIILLQAAIPPITAIPILTERSGGNRGITSQFIVASFLFSIVSIPAVLYLFSIYFPFPAS